MTTVSALATTMFLGGWHAPWPINMWDGANTGWWPLLWFTAKVWAFLFLYHLAARHPAAAALRPVHGAGLEDPHPGFAGLDHDRGHHAQPAHARATPHGPPGSSPSAPWWRSSRRRRAVARACGPETVRKIPVQAADAGAFPVPPLPAAKEPELMPKFLDALAGFGGHLRDHVQEADHRGVPGEAGPGRAALPRPPPAEPVSRRAGEVHRLRAVRMGLPRRRHLRRRRQQHRRGTLLARRAVRPRLPDQLSALHRLRAVHRGLPDPRVDHDQRLRDGRRQPRRPDLGQGQAARPDAARDGRSRRTRCSPAAPTRTTTWATSRPSTADARPNGPRGRR